MKILFITVSAFSCNTGGTIYSYGIMDRVADLTSLDILTYDTPIDKTNSFYYGRLKSKTNKIYKVQMKKTDLLFKYLKFQNTFVRYSREMEKKAKELLKKNQYDAVIIDHLRMGFITKIAKKFNRKVILIQHNIETQNYKEQLKLEGHTKYRIKNWGLPRFEKENLKLADVIWCITEKDLKYFSSLSGFEDKIYDVVLPYFPYQRIKKEYQTRKNLVITGTMSWYPNVEGVQWFIKHVFSKILQRDSEYKLYVVGRNPDKQLIKLNSDNVIVTGSVPSVDEYLKKADLLIVPNRFGGGAKIKIIEGVLKGVPCIVLRPSIAGYEEVIPDSDFVVDDEGEYLESILSINANIKKKEQFVEDFIDNINRNASLEQIIARLC